MQYKMLVILFLLCGVAHINASDYAVGNVERAVTALSTTNIKGFRALLQQTTASGQQSEKIAKETSEINKTLKAMYETQKKQTQETSEINKTLKAMHETQKKQGAAMLSQLQQMTAILSQLPKENPSGQYR